MGQSHRLLHGSLSGDTGDGGSDSGDDGGDGGGDECWICGEGGDVGVSKLIPSGFAA